MENGKSRRIVGKDGLVRGAVLRTNQQKTEKTDLITRPLQLLIPLEVSTSDDLNTKSDNRVTKHDDLHTKSDNRIKDFGVPGTNSGTCDISNINTGRPKRKAAIDATQKLKLI